MPGPYTFGVFLGYLPDNNSLRFFGFSIFSTHFSHFVKKYFQNYFFEKTRTMRNRLLR